MIKNCNNCGHRKGNGDFTQGYCIVSDFSCSTERANRTVCDDNFSKWVPRPGLWSIIKRLFS